MPTLTRRQAPGVLHQSTFVNVFLAGSKILTSISERPLKARRYLKFLTDYGNYYINLGNYFHNFLTKLLSICILKI
jgi:hypothetical protein